MSHIPSIKPYALGVIFFSLYHHMQVLNASEVLGTK